MAPEPSDPVLAIVLVALAIASIAVWFALAERLKDGTLLPFEPRRPVPWHGAWTLLPIILVVLTIASALTTGVDRAAEPESPRDLIERIAMGSAQQLALVAAFLTVVIASSGAKRTDLGLPKDGNELARDIRIGVVAWLASLAPVYLTQIVLVTLIGKADGHPLLRMVEEQSDPTLFILAFLAAVFVAPICEELLFRLVLQGWLEKWEDRRLGWRSSPAVVDSEPEDPDSSQTDIVDSAVVEIVSPISTDPATADPPAIGLAGLPHGWLPILISSALFALAHFGYGPDPIPLFFLAIILGYIYQRTHRIVPSMVAHALFNGMSLFALWRVMSAGGQ